MKNDTLTFNDLPMVVAQLRDEVVGMKQILSLGSNKKCKRIPLPNAFGA